MATTTTKLAAVLTLAALLGCAAQAVADHHDGYHHHAGSKPSSTAPPCGGEAPVLTVGHYHKTCRRAEAIVRDTVKHAVFANRGIGAGLIRLFFHDCFVQGCDASVLLDPTPANPQPEKLGLPNVNSLRGFEVIDAAKERIEKECGTVVSCADILAFAGRDATYYLSGAKVYYDMPAGRLDGRVSLAAETLKSLPPPFANVTLLKDMFAAKGLTAEEMVVLSGAHTVGVSHCSSFADRLPPNPSDMDAKLSRSLQRQCRSASGGDNLVVQDPVTPSRFDNEYYKNVLRHKVLFASDAALLTAPDTSSLVVEYAKDDNSWNDDFKAAMVRMGAIELKTKASGGEIRKTCRFVNTY